MTTFNPTFGSWQTTSVNSSTITNSSSATTSSAIDASGKTSTVVSVTVAYGGTATQGVVVSVLQDVDGSNFESTADIPWTMLMPFSISTTYRRVFSFPAALVPKFKVRLDNSSGASVTATVQYRQSTTDQS